jgi:hypothetical protein
VGVDPGTKKPHQMATELCFTSILTNAGFLGPPIARLPVWFTRLPVWSTRLPVWSTRLPVWFTRLPVCFTRLPVWFTRLAANGAIKISNHLLNVLPLQNSAFETLVCTLRYHQNRALLTLFGTSVWFAAFGAFETFASFEILLVCLRTALSCGPTFIILKQTNQYFKPKSQTVKPKLQKTASFPSFSAIWFKVSGFRVQTVKPNR